MSGPITKDINEIMSEIMDKYEKCLRNNMQENYDYFMRPSQEIIVQHNFELIKNCELFRIPKDDSFLDVTTIPNVVLDWSRIQDVPSILKSLENVNKESSSSRKLTIASLEDQTKKAENDTTIRKTDEKAPLKAKPALRFRIKKIPFEKEKSILSIKNNKIVYLRRLSYIDRRKYAEGEEKLLDPKKLISHHKGPNSGNPEKKGKRGSKYRGVSKNGRQWQTLIMVNKKKRYVGSFTVEENAARTYDKVAIQYHGPKAKTNFYYTEEEIQSILNASPIFRFDQ